MSNGNGSRLTNKEKSARRYASLTLIAQEYANEDSEFLAFCNGFSEVTWRKLETFLKRQFEAGKKIKIMIKSGEDGGK